MSRSFSWLAIALAGAVMAAVSPPAFAQPVPSSSGSPSPAATPDQKYPGLEEAKDYFGRTHDVNGTLAKLKEVARQNPELPCEYVMMFAALAKAQPNVARLLLERAVYDKDTMNDPEPWVILGDIAMQENRMAEGELDYLKARQLLTSYPNAKRKATIEQAEMLGMATVAERRERWQAAEDQLEEYRQRVPNDIVALQRLARVMFLQGKAGRVKDTDPVGAYDILKQAKDIDVKIAAEKKTHEQMLPAAAYMAQYYDQSEHAHEKGKYVVSKNARTWYEYALKVAPNDLNLRGNVLVWALNNGDQKWAKEQADKALEIEKEDAAKPQAQQRYAGSIAAPMWAGFEALWEKRYADAEKYFEQVHLVAPNDFAVKNDLALALVDQTDPAKKHLAGEYAMDSYTNNKENADALSTLSWVAFRTGEFRTADVAINQVLRATNGNLNPDTTVYLAYILDHNDRKYQAKQALQALVDSGRFFSMKPEALALYEKVKDAKAPETAPSPSSTSKSP